MVKKINLEIIEKDDRTTAIGLARFAFEYIDASITVNKNATEKNPNNTISPTPAYFLAYHGIELTLKAYLRHNGFTLRELRSGKYGHDLHACYRQAKQLKLRDYFRETQDDINAMDLLVALNVDHGLRYIQTGYKQFPLWSIVEPLAVRLHQAIAPLVGYRSFNKTY